MKTKPYPYDHFPAEQRSTAETALAASEWARHLPPGWRDAVDLPLYFAHHREYEIAAERTLGYDADGQPCFTAYHYTLTRSRNDNQATLDEEITCGERLAAWRLRDERWLVYRIATAGHGNPAQGFYTLSPDMPR